MAEAIADGIREVAPSTTVKVLNAAKEDKNDILTEAFHSKALLIGSPTINYGYSYAIAGILEMMRGLKFKNKKAAAFGSYGWSGDAVKMISTHLQEAGFTLINDGLRMLWVPDEEALKACKEYGKEIGKA
jgi:flavorubredoxin